MASPRTHALLLPLVVLSGCGGAAAAAPPPGSTASRTVAAAPSAPPPATRLVEPAVIAERKGEIGDEPVVLQLLQPRRRGATVVLDLRLTTEVDGWIIKVDRAFDDGTAQTTTDPDDAGTSEAASLDGIFLVDGGGQRRYLAARDRFGRCICDRDLEDVRVEPDAPLQLSVVLAAPPPGVEKVDVVIPRFGTFADVRIG